MKNVALHMFPSSHRPGEALEVCREVGKWLLANVALIKYNTMDAYLSISLFGISEENITLLTEVMEVMARKVQTDCPFRSLEIVIHDTPIQVPSSILFRLLWYSSSCCRSRGGFPNS